MFTALAFQNVTTDLLVEQINVGVGGQPLAQLRVSGVMRLALDCIVVWLE